MTHPPLPTNDFASQSVRRPLESDRLTEALRRAFRTNAVGAEFRRLLAELDRRTTRH